MQNGWIKSWRKLLDSPIWTQPRIYLHAWLWILHKVDQKTGTLVTSIGQIADGISTFERHAMRTPSKKIILDVLKWLEAENMITRESNALGTTLTIVNWGSYQNHDTKKVTKREPLPEPLREHITRSTSMRSTIEEVVEAGKKPPVRPRKHVAKQSDPQTNPKPFLEEIEKSGTVVIWGRDTKALQNIMASRVRAGVPDVITELWAMWGLFKGGAIDEIYKMQGRAHDIQSFCMTYSELLEKSNGSVKPGRAGCVCGGTWKREYSPAVGDIWRCEKCKRMKESERQSGFRERK